MRPPPQSIAELDERASAPSPGLLDTLRSIEGDLVIAGAGGKMGFHLSLMLRRGLEQIGKKTRVVAVSRFGDGSVRRSFEVRGIDTLTADLTDPDTTKSLPDAGALYYLAGRKFGTSDSPEILELFNETMPALVAERYAGTPTVALSTGCVYPFVTPESGGSKESDPIGPQGDYAVSCAGRERAFLDASARHGTPLSLIRLNYSVDLRYGVLVDLAVKVHAGQPVDVTMGYLNCIWQGDAIDHTIRSLALAAPEPAPCLLNVTGPRTLRVREVAEWFAHRFEKEAIITDFALTSIRQERLEDLRCGTLLSITTAYGWAPTRAFTVYIQQPRLWCIILKPIPPFP